MIYSRMYVQHKQPATLQDAKDHLRSWLAMYETSPAVGDYHRGTEAALRELQSELAWDLDHEKRPSCGSNIGQ